MVLAALTPMRRWAVPRRFLAFSIVLQPLIAHSQTLPTATPPKKLFDLYWATLRSVAHVSFDATTDMDLGDLAGQVFPKRRIHTGRVYRDSDSSFWENSRSDQRSSEPETAQTIEVGAVSLATEKFLRYNKSFVVLEKPGPIGTNWFAATQETRGLLDGVSFPDNGKSLMSLVEQATTLELGSEVIDGRETQRVTATGAMGQLSLWLDPTKGYLPRRILLTKERGDSLYDAVLPRHPPQQGSGFVASPRPSSPLIGHEVLVDHIDIVEVGNTFFIAGGHITETETYENGKTIQISLKHVRANITPADARDVLSAFGERVPNGTRVHRPDSPSIVYEWMDGRIVPRVEDAVTERVASLLEGLSERDSEADGPPTRPASSGVTEPQPPVRGTGQEPIVSGTWILGIALFAACALGAFLMIRVAKAKKDSTEGRGRRFFARSLLLTLLCAACAILQCQKAALAARRDSERTNGIFHYCGVYCVYAAAQLLGKDIELVQLLRPEYVGTVRGSSLAELELAAQRAGLFALPATNLSFASLRGKRYSEPTILHVRRDVHSNEYDHFVLLLGATMDSVTVFEPGTGVLVIGVDELLWRWDGIAVLLSTEPLTFGARFVPEYRRLLGGGAVLFLAVLTVGVLERRLRRNSQLHFRVGIDLASAFMLCATATGLGFAYQYCGDGILAHPKSIRFTQIGNFPNLVPEVTKEDLNRIVEDVIVVDARHSRDFDSGHLRSAISIPVTASDVELRDKIEGLQKDKRVVVYCQSRSCSYANRIGARLFAEGFVDIAVYKNGWADWMGLSSNEGCTSK
jgi:rhodanese-related sulfurtransferase